MDNAEIEKLVEDNMALAHFFAKKWHWWDYNDAFSIAMQGLLKAAQHFDASKGIPFGSYASVLIARQKIREVQHQNRTKRAGRFLHLHLEAPLGEDGKTLADVMVDHHAKSSLQVMLGDEEVALMERLVARLNARERFVIERRFGLDGREYETLDQIASAMGLTRESVRQIEALALKRMAVWRQNIEDNLPFHSGKIRTKKTRAKYGTGKRALRSIRNGTNRMPANL